MANMIPVLLTAGHSREEECNIISSFNEDQKALLQSMYATCILSRARLQYDIDHPTVHVIEAARLDGMCKLLQILLGNIPEFNLEDEGA